jgi:hypothetical protein
MPQYVSKYVKEQMRISIAFVNCHTPLSGRTELCTLTLPLLLRTVTVRSAVGEGAH